MTRAKSVTSRRLLVFLLSAAASAVLFGVLVQSFGSAEEGLRRTLRFSGRLSFGLFLIPLLASSLLRLKKTPLTRSLVKYRAEFGLAFAGAHIAHLAMILWLATLPGRAEFLPMVIAFGGFGFVVIAAMAVTSFPAVAKALGRKRWQALHTFGIHYIAVIFAYDWFKGLAREPITYAPLALLLVAAFAIRVTARRRVPAGAAS